ncbi:MAG: hypothetical protein HN657_02635 [Candidatus Marinimicrobia bacterium]|nr:hypothetical protein [Candidatus Neomarinimicrobiota bacterium]MBT3496600.1 hypothetical protein [Candidatus Neomarinimicrobiota bacterium]MBT3692265.1 hypothetical protein [Candidatus Neomarinimicrobiota bacterium]MBT3732952.1 hypothetical protein [Candidatus Neomarinimicrobiota bacterium]MBT4144997.1 hypothetical protein [Candidatus Neomarinimicrobiota bacterium]
MDNTFTEIQKVMEPNLVLLDIKEDESAQMIRIIIDSERPVTLEDTVGLMKTVNNDETLMSLFPESYRLEITSPGMGAELKRKFQFRKNVGKILEIKVVENGEYIKRLGLLSDANENEITIEQDGESFCFDYDAIKSAKIKISFN